MILILHAAATWYMVGLIWMVQVVHYPLFAWVGEDRFERYESEHQARTTWVVLPPMLVELATAAWLSWRPPLGISVAETGVGAALVALIWASTFFLQVPEHARLERAWNDRAHRRLVVTNWLRTIAWSARGLLVAWWLVRV